jgi:hypothetical protein
MDLVAEIMLPIKSVTQVTEVFYFTSLAAVLLQQKAKLRQEDILKNAAPEHSVATMIISQFSDLSEDDESDIRSDSNKRGYSVGKELAARLSQDFEYNGRAMRALATVSIMGHSVIRLAESRNSPGYALTNYEPTKALLSESVADDYSVIGKHRSVRIETGYSPKHADRFERDKNSRFCVVFMKKLSELFDLKEMNMADRARIEELRDYYAETLCKCFLNVEFINFPRVLHFIAAVNKHSDEKGRISEEALYDITPPECAAFINYESILTKDSVDMDMTWYRINSGIRSFAELVRQFNLLSGYKQALMNDVTEHIK